ncbi:MAG: YVTN family beta-propeller repeat protein [Candidatus Tyrphobacter sp.]
MDMPVGMHPAHVVLDPSGGFAYVTLSGENSVDVMDLHFHMPIARIRVGAFPHGMRMSSDGRWLYVANTNGGTLSAVDLRKRSEVFRVKVGAKPIQVAVSRDQRTVFVSVSGEDDVAVINIKKRIVIRHVEVGRNPAQIYVSPDGAYLVVANQGTAGRPDNTVTVVDAHTYRVTATIVTGAGAHGVVITPDSRFAYVTNAYASDVSVVDLRLLETIRSYPTGRGPNGITLCRP